MTNTELTKPQRIQMMREFTPKLNSGNVIKNYNDGSQDENLIQKQNNE
jgi:hypothetical protein